MVGPHLHILVLLYVLPLHPELAGSRVKLYCLYGYGEVCANSVGSAGASRRFILNFSTEIIEALCTVRYVGSAPHLIVVDLMLSPSLTRLYACHMSSDSSGISTTCLETRRHDRTGALPGQFQVKAGETHPMPLLSMSRCTSFMA